MPEHSIDQSELVTAWRTNNRVNLYLLGEISDEGLRCSLSKRGGRDVARQFAHMHDVRVRALQSRAKDLADDLVVFPSKCSPDRSDVEAALEASSEAIERFLLALLAGEPKRRGFKRGWPTHLSYFIAHEAHHRGSILLTLKECGHAPDRDVRMGIWDWDRL